MTPTRGQAYVVALLVAYCYLPVFQLFVVDSAGAHPHLDQVWYGSLAAAFIPPFAACLVVGWMASWRRSLLHGVSMGAATVAAYALLDVVEQPETYAEPITWKTAPLFFLGLSIYYVLGTILGSTLRFIWTRASHRSASTKIDLSKVGDG